jgi:hypothetical protein
MKAAQKTNGHHSVHPSGGKWDAGSDQSSVAGWYTQFHVSL